MSWSNNIGHNKETIYKVNIERRVTFEFILYNKNWSPQRKFRRRIEDLKIKQINCLKKYNNNNNILQNIIKHK